MNGNLDASINELKAKIEAGYVRDELYATNASLQSELDNAKAELHSYADDNVITVLEKRSIKQLFDDISTNHNNDRQLYTSYGGKTTDTVYTNENSAYTTLQSFVLNKVLSSPTTNTTLSNGERNAYNTLLNNWYRDNAKLDSSVNALKAKLEASTSAAAVAAELHAKNTALQSEIDNAKLKLNSYANDNVITVLEKRSIR
jgi:hypothetical protein